MNIVYGFTADTSITFKSSYSQQGITNNSSVEPPFFYNGCEECLYVGETPTKANDNSFAISYSESQNECGGVSSKGSCKGRCDALSAGFTTKEVGIPYRPTTTASQKVKLTCVDGFSSQNNSTEEPYSGSATIFCKTNTNKDGRDLSFSGIYNEEPKLSCVKYPKDATIFPGAGLPLKYTTKMLTWTDPFGVNSDGFGDCNTPQTLSAYPEYYSSSKVECSNDYPNAPLGGCEYFYHFSSSGKYINYTTKISDFETIGASIPSSQTLAIKSGTTQIKAADTFKYTNQEVTASSLSLDDQDIGKVTYLYIDNKNVSSYEFDAWTGQRKPGDKYTVFESGKAECTRTEESNKNDPCKNINTPQTTTITDFAGITWSAKELFYSATPLGSFHALELKETTRTFDLRYGNFDYTVSTSEVFNNVIQEQRDISCMSHTSSKSMYMESNYIPFKCEKDPDNVCICNDEIGNTTYEAAKWPQKTQSKVEYNTGCFDFGCGGKTSSCSSEVTYNIFTSQRCQTTQVTGCNETPAPLVDGPDGYKRLGPIPAYNIVVGDVPIEKQWNDGSTCNITFAMAAGQSVTHRTFERTEFSVFGTGQEKIYAKAIYPFGILRTNTDSANPYTWNTTFSVSDKNSIIKSSHIVQAFQAIQGGLAYSPPVSGIRLTEASKTTFMLFSSTSTDKNSYLVSSASSKGVWEKASWSGFGVFRGPFKSGTFDVAFSGVKSNTQAFLGNRFVYSPGAKQTFVCDGGLNIISSRPGSSGKFSTTSSTNAFSTSFDSTHKGAFIVRHIPFTTCRTKPANDLGGFAIEELECDDACEIDNVAQNVLGIATIGETSTYLIQGDKSKLYMNNSMSYFWTSPEKHKAYGTGHGVCTQAD